MGFLKLPHLSAYYTGGLRTNLDLPCLARKLTRAGLRSTFAQGVLKVHCGDDEWRFGDWQLSGLGRVGWLEFTIDGDLGTLSRRLAAIGVRHKLDHSRPQDVGVVDARCVTQYEYRWHDDGGLGIPGARPRVETFDEYLEA